MTKRRLRGRNAANLAGSGVRTEEAINQPWAAQPTSSPPSAIEQEVFPTKPKTSAVTIHLPTQLYRDVSALLEDRHLTLDEVVRLYMRALLTTSKRGMALGLDDDIGFGKYRGEKLEVVIRAEPSYIVWCMQNMENFLLGPDALALLQQLRPEA